MAILNYTTEVDANKSAAEVQTILAKAGASTVASMYEHGSPVGVAFSMLTEFGERNFRLPVNTEGVFNAMKGDQKIPPRLRTREQAFRVSWRILKDWIEAQIALVQVGMSSMDEVMLPYMVTGSGETMAQVYRGQQLAIEASR